jgi:hypothetical protein
MSTTHGPAQPVGSPPVPTCEADVETIPKPDELLALHDVTEELFDTLAAWFDVPESVEITLDDIDAAVTELGDPVMIAAMAMRKLQALRLLSTPGVKTTTDVVVAIVQDLERALVQAPSMRLRRAAARADWDAALADLVSEGVGEAPSDPSGGDDEVQRFRELHGQLHDALRAVVQASEGQIRTLV